MEESILETIAFWVMDVISNLGYPGIFILMALESALIPIPSEIIMPFSGFLVSEGRFNLMAITFAGASGNLVGSWAAYALGYWGHRVFVRRFISKFGKFILLTEEEYDSALKLFKKYGQWVAAIARVLPAIRTVISLPAGVVRLPFLKFSVLTFFGSLIWSFFLGYIGLKLGENWQIIRPYFRKFDIAIIAVTIILLGVYIHYKLRKKQKTR
ncbi:DedA family protein [Candidatus Curtissbacteria bacterium]|nr:DedA family protein [Candidatus Curtissbacteria bacterium]